MNRILKEAVYIWKAQIWPWTKLAVHWCFICFMYEPMKSCMLWFKGEGNAQQGCEPELFMVFVCFWGVLKEKPRYPYKWNKIHSKGQGLFLYQGEKLQCTVEIKTSQGLNTQQNFFTWAESAVFSSPGHFSSCCPWCQINLTSFM